MNIGIREQNIIEKDNEETDILLRPLINGKTIDLIKKSGKYNNKCVLWGLL